MQVKDEEYLKRNILSIYGEKQNNPFYRFVGQPEFETLFRDKKLYFTNPSEWKYSETGDKKETYFEEWFVDENNISKAYSIIKQYYINTQNYCDQQYIMSVYSNFVGAVALLQQMSFCYCISNSYSDKRMIDEYHKKCGRNIILCYKEDFFEKLSILSNLNFLPNGTYLYADAMPMVYIHNFEEFIKRCICTCQSSSDIAKNVFDYGAFLKDAYFEYEHETRIKLRMHVSGGYDLRYLSNEFYSGNLNIHDENEIITNSINYIKKCGENFNKAFLSVPDKIKTISNKQCFELCLNEVNISEIINGILLHRYAPDNEKNVVYNYAKKEKIPVEELNFDYMYSVDSLIEDNIRKKLYK